MEPASTVQKTKPTIPSFKHTHEVLEKVIVGAYEPHEWLDFLFISFICLLYLLRYIAHCKTTADEIPALPLCMTRVSGFSIYSCITCSTMNTVYFCTLLFLQRGCVLWRLEVGNESENPH